MEDISKRYMNDSNFHSLVTALEDLIIHLQFTPGEVRDAAMLAAIRASYRTEFYVPKTQDADRR